MNFARRPLRVTEHPESGKVDGSLSKKEIVLSYIDNEVLAECASDEHLTIAEFEITAGATPMIVNGLRVVVWELSVSCPIGGSINGEENDMPF